MIQHGYAPPSNSGPVAKRVKYVSHRSATICIIAFAAIEVMLSFGVETGALRPQNLSLHQGTVLVGIIMGDYACLVIAFLTWFHGVYRNLFAFDPSAPKSTAAWSVVCWLVPVVNLAFPLIRFLEIWKFSDPRTDITDDRSLRSQLGSGLIITWWVFWAIEEGIIPRFTRHTPLKTPVHSMTPVDAIPPLITITLLVLTCMVVVAINSRQNAKANSILELEAQEVQQASN